jgi:hypothetical protein
MSAHPLTTFVYETFGQQFGDLLLAGYGAEPSGRRRRLYLTEAEAGVETHWVIELVSRHPPCGDAPLVLAALLKLLLRCPSVAQHIEFDLGELLAELQWRDEERTRQQVETAIGGYVRLLYDKQVDARVGQHTSAAAGGGYYHLLTGYVRGAKSGAGSALDRTLGGVYFDSSFIDGLTRGRVCFAGIDSGPLKSPND